MSDMDRFNDTEQKFMEELKQEFKEKTAADLKETPKLFKENKLDKIAFIAHDIKGSAAHFGLDEGGEIAEKLETAAKNKELEETKKFLDQLTEYMRQNGIID